MSYLEALRARRKTPAAAWHKLRTSLATKKFDFFAAFEGEEDEEFYSTFLAKQFPGKRFRPVICEGKGGVLALHEDVIATYGDPQNVFFFIDSDHDPFTGQHEYPIQTFSTCGYSVENYIYDTEVILAGINKHFQLNTSDELCEDIRKVLECDRSVFEARARSVMSYAIALRSNDQNPNMDNIRLDSMFVLGDHQLKRKKIDCATLLAAAEVKPLSSKKTLQYMRLLRGTNPNTCFRGKLVAQFVVNFCRRLAKRFGAKKKLNGKPLKAKIEFGKKNLVSVFVDFVEIPDRLSAFFCEMAGVLGEA